MTIQVVDQDSVLEQALELVHSAKKRIWLTSPWITGRAVNLLLRDVLPRVRAEGIEVNIVYRVKEQSDLAITDLASLEALEDAGCVVRYSTRLHAKLLLVDETSAIVSSSNLTQTAGYSADFPPQWRNEELGLRVDNDSAVLDGLKQSFRAIWDSATSVTPETLGIAMDFPSVRGFNFVAIRDVRQGQFVTAGDDASTLIVGQIAELTAYNRSFPQMSQEMWITQGFSGGADSRGSKQIPDLQSLFSGPSKEHGFLVTKTFFEPESVFRIARVNVLKHREKGKLIAPSVPIAPGSDVTIASPELLVELLGGGEVPVGSVQHHPEARVQLRRKEIYTKHLAVLGMTGSGKSNCVKVLLRELLVHPKFSHLRVVVIDPHGEYQALAASLSSESTSLEVELREHILDANLIKSLAGLDRQDNALVAELRAIQQELPAEGTLEDFLLAVETHAPGSNKQDRLEAFVGAARSRDDLCLRAEENAVFRDDSGADESISEPGLYVLSLRNVLGLTTQSEQAAAVMRYLFEDRRKNPDSSPVLVVLEEAQNFCPESNTGLLTLARASHDAAMQLATEGRKFEIGLLISTQRPARVSKDILSQCNSQIIFRVANQEDLGAIKGSFEGASRELIESLPSFATGTGVAGGTFLDMTVPLEVPLFEDEPPNKG